MNEKEKFASKQLERLLKSLPANKIQAMVDRENGKESFNWAGVKLPMRQLLQSAGYKLTSNNEVIKLDSDEDSGEVVGVAWDAESDIISNQRPTKQKMVKQKSADWNATTDTSASGQMVWFKTAKNGRAMYGVQGANGIVRVSKQFIAKGTHPAKRIYKRKPGVMERGTRPYVIGGAPRKDFLAGRKLFAAQTVGARRYDRKHLSPLVRNIADYNPKTTDMIGIDTPAWRAESAAKWNVRKGAYVVPKKRAPLSAEMKAALKAHRKSPSDATRAAMKALRAKPSAAAPVMVPLSSAQLAAIVDDERSVLGVKRGFTSIDDDNKEYEQMKKSNRGRGRPKGAKNRRY